MGSRRAANPNDSVTIRTPIPASSVIHSGMRVSTSKIVACVTALAIVVAIAATPQLLGPKVASALSSLHGADGGWLVIATVGFAAGFLSCVGAWCAALTAAGGRI